MTGVPDWRLIADAPKDGSTILAWDGEVLAYPLAARWAWEAIREPAFKRQERRSWPVVACKPGQWQPIEQEMIDLIAWLGGLRQRTTCRGSRRRPLQL